jgi:predicted lipoprotein
MRSFPILSILAFFVLFCISNGCAKKASDKEKPQVDKTAMFTNIGNNIIIPNYQALKIAVDKLDSATTAFNSNPDNTNLANLQNLYTDTYRTWQKCSVFEFGPAETEYLRNNVNIFPTDTVQINSNIASAPGSFDLNSIANWKAKGLPGLDYLLYGTGIDNNAILLKFTTDGQAANRKTYLAALTADMKTKVNNVLNGWLPTGGNYISTFINSNGTDIGSSLGLLVNQLNYDLEVIKNFELGIPTGKQSAGVIHPEKVEAFYSGNSIELALLQLHTIENIFLGVSQQGNGPGFDDYLDQIGAQYNGGPLSSVIKNQFSITFSKLQLVPDPLSATIQNNITVADDAFLQLQQLVILLKTDMPSAMGVLISYADTDGD